jgi:excisionase family DNA binding protein
VKQAAAALGYSRQYVYFLMEHREITFIQCGTTKRIPISSIEEFIAKNTVPARDRELSIALDQNPSYRSPAKHHRPKPKGTA